MLRATEWPCPGGEQCVRRPGGWRPRRDGVGGLHLLAHWLLCPHFPFRLLRILLMWGWRATGVGRVGAAVASRGTEVGWAHWGVAEDGRASERASGAGAAGVAGGLRAMRREGLCGNGCWRLVPGAAAPREPAGKGSERGECRVVGKGRVHEICSLLRELELRGPAGGHGCARWGPWKIHRGSAQVAYAWLWWGVKACFTLSQTTQACKTRSCGSF